MELTVWTIFVASLITALATGLGAIPFFFVKDIQRQWLGIANATAAGLMLGASHGLINEGISYSLGRLLVGLLVGVIFMSLTHHVLAQRDDLHVGALQGANAKKVLMIMGVMTVHSFAEGVAVGVSFGGGETLGGLITAAVALHNIPEGLAICIVLVPRGVSPWRGSLWSIFSSLPQPLMAVPAFLFVTAFTPILPVGLGFAAGAMIWMVFAELLPDALEEASANLVAIVVTLSLAAMIALQVLIVG